MSGDLPRWDLACFSYLAHAQVLHVARYPDPNRGAEVRRTFTWLAGDGPIVAQASAARGLRTALVANKVAHGPAGQHVQRILHAAGVHHQGGAGPTPPSTPQLTVVTDDTGTRTWFADLTHAYTSLHHADTAPLGRARLAYIDGYTVIADTAATALHTAATAGVPVLLNLGGDPLQPQVRQAARYARLYVVQTSLPETQAGSAEQLARTLLEELNPQAAVVTLGALGAIAVTRTTQHRKAARAIHAVHTHGAGAAFSAGLATAYLQGHDLPDAVVIACEVGTAHCTTIPGTDTRRTAS